MYSKFASRINKVSNELKPGWASFMLGGLHQWVMNYQRAASFKSKEFSLNPSTSVYF